jgi:KTSC domain
MLRTVVDSTTFRSLGYDAEQGVLEVEFVNGHVYQYLDVPRELYEEMRDAPSMGRYYLDRIRDSFQPVPLR